MASATYAPIYDIEAGQKIVVDGEVKTVTSTRFSKGIYFLQLEDGTTIRKNETYKVRIAS